MNCWRLLLLIQQQRNLFPIDVLHGRRLLVSLTRAGQQFAEKAAPNALAISRETLAPLDAREREALVELLNKLR